MPLRQILDLGFHLDVGAFEEAARLLLAEVGMDVGEQREQLAHPEEARQARDVGDEGDVLHQLGALGEGILAEHPDRALVGGQARAWR